MKRPLPLTTIICASPSEPFFKFRRKVITLRDGTQIRIRPITAVDEPQMVAFHKTLSALSIHFRYFGMLSLGTRIGHERLAALCATDPSCEIALVAEFEESKRQRRIL